MLTPHRPSVWQQHVNPYLRRQLSHAWMVTGPVLPVRVKPIVRWVIVVTFVTLIHFITLALLLKDIAVHVLRTISVRLGWPASRSVGD
jgi:hypothetical protein